MSCFAIFNGSIATSRKGYVNLIFVVYLNYVLAGFDSHYYTSQQFFILVMYPFRIKNSSSNQQQQLCLYKKVQH